MSNKAMVSKYLTVHAEWEHADRIPDKIRDEVLERDNYQCQLCGTGGENRLQLHHWMHFRSKGGAHTLANLVTLCFRCHRDVHEARADIVVIQYDDGTWGTFPSWRHR